eukprot:1278232-Rhodomonas_salina.1
MDSQSDLVRHGVGSFTIFFSSWYRHARYQYWPRRYRIRPGAPGCKIQIAISGYQTQLYLEMQDAMIWRWDYSCVWYPEIAIWRWGGPGGCRSHRSLRAQGSCARKRDTEG